MDRYNRRALAGRIEYLSLAGSDLDISTNRISCLIDEALSRPTSFTGGSRNEPAPSSRRSELLTGRYREGNEGRLNGYCPTVCL